jgi:NAD-dependent SIR2 family protein deacetylase
MIVVSRKLDGDAICNSCLNRSTGAYKISIGRKNKSYMTDIHLCKICLEDLVNTGIVLYEEEY